MEKTNTVNRPVDKYVLTSNKEFHPQLTVHNILGREVPEMIAPAQSVTGKFCGIKRGRLETMEQTLTLIVDERHVEVVTGKFGAFTGGSKQEKAALTLAGKKGTEATLSMNEDDTAITLSIKDGISITEPIHNMSYERLLDSSVKLTNQETFKGKLVAVDYDGPVLMNDAGEIVQYKASLNNTELPNTKVLVGNLVQVSLNDQQKLTIQSLEKAVEKEPDIEKKHFYVLTHRTDLPDNVETFKEGQRITHPVQAISGQLNHVTSSGFVLKQGEEPTVVSTNKLLSADLVKALDKADTVNIHLDKTGTLLTVSYLDGEQEAQKRAGKQVESQVVTQRFNGPAIPFGVINDADLTKPEHQQKVFSGQLQNVYGTKDKQILELKSANGTKLVHGLREATSEATLRKFIGQDVKVQGFDGGLRMTPEKTSPEVSLNQR